MRKTNDKRKGKSVFPRTVMCLCLAAALACGTLLPDSLSSYQVRAEEATADSAAGEAVETTVAEPATTPQVETSETTQDTTTGTQESGEIAAPQS